MATLAEVLAALPVAAKPALIGVATDRPLPALTDDSRAVRPGAAFIAVPGVAHDGHEFLAAAAAAGAELLIVDRRRFAAWAPGLDAATLGLPRLEVDDIDHVYPQLAAAWYGWPGRQLRLAGITGTNGKTTTAHLLAAILRQAGRPHLRLGTTGNWLVDHESHAGFTTPFPVELQGLLARARDAGARDGVMEVSSHALVQGRVQPLRYQAVALTSFSQDHLDFHSSMVDYLRAKCLLARNYCDPRGVAVAPREQGEAAAAFLRAAAEAGVARCWSTSRDPERDPSQRAAIQVRAVLDHDGPGQAVEVDTPAGALTLRSPLVGAFNLDNLLVTVGLALGLELELETIAAALAEARGAPGRLEPVRVPDCPGPAVYVDYAHTPDAVARSLDALRPSVRGRLIVVLGCGGDRDPSKRPLMGRVAADGADLFFATSDNPRSEAPEAILDQMLAGVQAGPAVRREVDRARAIAAAVAEAGSDDVVLIAGKGHESYQIIGGHTIHFDDREHAEAALRARSGG